MENQNLTLNDMVSLRNCLDAACTRGAFKANEMKAIGELYDKLSRFIDESQKQAAEAASAEAQPAAESQTPQGE